MSGGVETGIILLILLNIPMFLRVLRVASPLSIDPKRWRFRGRHSGWTITSITGKVLASSTVPGPMGDRRFRGPMRPGTSGAAGGWLPTSTTTSDFAILNGAQHDVSVRNFSARVQEADVVTAGFAAKGRKSFTFAILDYTTNRQFFNDGDLNKIASPRHGFMVFWLFVSCLTIVGIPIAFSYAILMRRQPRRFRAKGVMPLWEATRPSAMSLMTHSA